MSNLRCSDNHEDKLNGEELSKEAIGGGLWVHSSVLIQETRNTGRGSATYEVRAIR